MEEIWYSETITCLVRSQLCLLADIPEHIRVTEFLLLCAMGYGERPENAEGVLIYLGRCALRDFSDYMAINRCWLLEYLQVHGSEPKPMQPFIIGPFVAKIGGKPEAPEDGKLIAAKKPVVYAGVCRQPGEVFPLYGRKNDQAEYHWRRILGFARGHQWRRRAPD